MSEGIGPQGGEIEVSPEEKRFLKRFFRRQAMPWFAAALVMGVASAWLLRVSPDDALEVRTTAALAQLRSENERLHERVVTLTERVEAAMGAGASGADQLERRIESARQNVRMIEARVTAALDRRIDALEAHIANAPRRPAADLGELPSDVSAWDASAILERLYALEMRQDGASGGGGGAASRSRLAELERRLSRIEGRSSSPASIPTSATQ